MDIQDKVLTLIAPTLVDIEDNPVLVSITAVVAFTLGAIIF